MNTLLKKLMLIAAFFSVVTIGSMYGVSPSWFFESMLVGQSSPSVDQSHILRVIMVMYITFGTFWLYCAFSNAYRNVGIITLCLFCLGLMTGRLLSVIVDGMPSPLLLVYIAIEFVVVVICLWLLFTTNKTE